jgi:hypothetical protein
MIWGFSVRFSPKKKERRGSLLVIILLTQMLATIVKCQFKRLKQTFSQSTRALVQA